MKSKKLLPIYRNIKQIYIGNILEAYYRSYTYDKLPIEEASFWKKYDALDNNRSLLYGGDDKILITPEEMDSNHIGYICSLVGWKNVFNLVPERKSECISTDILKDQDFYKTLYKIIENNPGIELLQYRHTPEFYQLADRLQAEKLNVVFPELVPKENKFIEEYFHSKRGFRHLWEQVKDLNLRIQIPEGFILGDKAEAIEAAWWFKKQNRNFVIKYNRGVQGVGIVLNQAADLPEKYSDFLISAEKILEDGIWNEPCIEVEEMIEVNKDVLGGSPNVEMRIYKNGNVHREYACAQVLDPDGKTFLGVTMNPEVDNNKHIQQAFRAAELYGERLARLGYRGVFDMDLVVSTDDKLFAVEANLRRTGGTHVHEFCKTLLGEDYSSHYHIHLQDVDVPDKKRADLIRILDKYSYDPINKTGMISVNPDLLKCGKAPILTIATNEKNLDNLLAKLREI